MILILENSFPWIQQKRRCQCATIQTAIVLILGLALKIAIAKTLNESAPVTCFVWVTGVVDRDKLIELTMMIATTIGQLSSRYGIVWLAIPALMMLCSSCVSIQSNGIVSMQVHPSPNWNERQCPVSMLALHYTALPTCEDSLARLCDPTNSAGRVSAHYLVDVDGTIYQLVDESKRAWHAGVGSWRGLDKINDRSIGIEIQNIGMTEDGKRVPFPACQIDAVIALCKDIKARYGISNRDIFGHSDSAPTRKIDPGEAFPWRKFAAAGVGIWTDDFAEPKKSVPEMLSEIGYDVSDLDKAVVAFQRHFYPEAITSGATNTVGRMAAVCLAIRNKKEAE